MPSSCSCGKIESELAGLSDEEAREFCAELGIERSGLDELALRAYDLLGLDDVSYRRRKRSARLDD